MHLALGVTDDIAMKTLRLRSILKHVCEICSRGKDIAYMKHIKQNAQYLTFYTLPETITFSM